MASISRRTTRASVRASPAPSVDDMEEPAAAVTPRASSPNRRRTEGGQRRTPTAAITLSVDSARLGTASVARPAALRRQLKKSASADVFGQANEGPSMSLPAPLQPSRSSSRRSSARPGGRAASIMRSELPTTLESYADTNVEGNPIADVNPFEDHEDLLEGALRSDPDALSPILGTSMRLLGHYFGTLDRPMPENLPDIYFQMMLEAMTALAPSLALESSPYQLQTARHELRVANAAIFLRGIWLNDDQLADGGVVRPEKVRDFAEARIVFLDVFVGPGGVEVDDDLLRLLIDLCTQLYILQRRTTVNRTTAARNALIKQLFPHDLHAIRGSDAEASTRWRELCQDRVGEIKNKSLEDLRVEHPYHDFRRDIVAFCKSIFETGAEGGEDSLGAALLRRSSGPRRSLGAGDIRSSTSVPARGRRSEPIRRPRYTADLPAPLGPRSSPFQQGRQSMPAGVNDVTSRPYTPSYLRRKTPVVVIPPDEESTADEAALRIHTTDEAQTDADEADDDELVENELSELENDQAGGSSDDEQAADAEMETGDQAILPSNESDVDGDNDTDLEAQDRLDAADRLTSTPHPSPRIFQPREGKQREALSVDGGEPLPHRAASSAADIVAVPVDDEEDEVALLTQVVDDESQPLPNAADNIPWDSLWDDDESTPYEDRRSEGAEAPPPLLQAVQQASPVRSPSPRTEAIVRTGEPVIVSAEDAPSAPIFDNHSQDAMGGAWSPAPEQGQDPPEATGSSQSGLASDQASAGAPRPLASTSRPTRPSAANRQRPGRARPSQALRGDFAPLEDSDQDVSQPLALPPLQPPRSINRHSPVDFDPPPRTGQRAVQRNSRRSPSPPPPTPRRDGSVVSGGRHFWTEDETLFLVRKAIAIHSENNNPFATLVRNYGAHGYKNMKLAGRTNVQLKDKLRHYLSTSYKFPKPVPVGLERYLPSSDPRHKSSRRAVTASQAQAASRARKRPRGQSDEVNSDSSSDPSEVNAESMESEGE